MNIFTYLRESRAELAKVIWPTPKQTRDHTVMVVAFSLAVALFLGLIDFGLEWLVKYAVIR